MQETAKFANWWHFFYNSCNFLTLPCRLRLPVWQNLFYIAQKTQDGNLGIRFWPFHIWGLPKSIGIWHWRGRSGGNLAIVKFVQAVNSEFYSWAKFTWEKILLTPFVLFAVTFSVTWEPQMGSTLDKEAEKPALLTDESVKNLTHRKLLDELIRDGVEEPQ